VVHTLNYVKMPPAKTKRSQPLHHNFAPTHAQRFDGCWRGRKGLSAGSFPVTKGTKMKKSITAATITAVALLLLAVALFPGVAGAQGQNLLKNPGFEDGHHKQDGIAEITVPDGWVMHWSDGESQIFDGYAVTARPETVVWNIKGAPAGDEGFWKDGIYTVKIFKSWAPMWAAMSQDVSGLEVGRKYRLVAPIFVDIVADYKNGKVPPVDGRQGRVRLGASPIGAAWRNESAIAYSGWWTGETMSPFYQAYSTFVYDFTATAPDMTVWIEMASNYPHPNNGFFMDAVGLYALDEFGDVAAAPAAGGNQAAAVSAAPAGPTATPLPTATMGITPEEALVKIPELNNNPAVLNSGDELIIVPPSAEAAATVQAAAASDAQPTPAEGADAAAATPQPDETAAGEAATGVDTAVAETDSSRAANTSNIAAALPAVSPSSICVQVFEDVNGDGVRASTGEPPIADQAVTLSRGGNTVSTYITDGSENIYCFEKLESDTYQVQLLPTADYVLTGDDSWAVGMAEGVMIPVSFGLQKVSSEIAEAAPADAAAVSAVEPAAAETPVAPMNNVGLIALGVGGVLILLAGAGVYLLRRG
jgi:hypothetical protein